MTESADRAHGRSKWFALIALACAAIFTGWVVLWTPSSRPAVILLAALAAVSCGLAAVLIPWNAKLKVGGAVGALVLGLILAWVAVPEKNPELVAATDKNPEVPLLVSVGDGFDDPQCELLVVQDVDGLPDRGAFDPPWVWAHGGGSGTMVTILTIEGRSDQAVILHSIEVIDIERLPLGTDAAQITKCEPSGGALGYRSFEIDFDNPATKAELTPETNENGEITRFPFKVSSSDPELFAIHPRGAAPCICAYRLKVNWTSGGESGSVVVEREFGQPFRNSTTRELPGYYWLSDDDLQPWN